MFIRSSFGTGTEYFVGGYCSPAYASTHNIPYNSDTWVKFLVIVLLLIDFVGKGCKFHVIVLLLIDFVGKGCKFLLIVLLLIDFVGNGGKFHVIVLLPIDFACVSCLWTLRLDLANMWFRPLFLQLDLDIISSGLQIPSNCSLVLSRKLYWSPMIFTCPPKWLNHQKERVETDGDCFFRTFFFCVVWTDVCLVWSL